MSKCIKLKNSKEVVRVSDEAARLMHARGEGVYVSKTEWKHGLKTLQSG